MPDCPFPAAPAEFNNASSPFAASPLPYPVMSGCPADRVGVYHFSAARDWNEQPFFLFIDRKLLKNPDFN
jgi:hypothetical protein